MSKSLNKCHKTRQIRRALKGADIRGVSGRKLARVGYGCGIDRRSYNGER